MNTISMELMDKVTDARRQVEFYCQTLVDTGTAQWLVNDAGETELHMNSGETYLFGRLYVTRLK